MLTVGDNVEIILKGKVVGFLPCGHVVIEIEGGKNPTKTIIRDKIVSVPPKNIITPQVKDY